MTLDDTTSAAAAHLRSSTRPVPARPPADADAAESASLPIRVRGADDVIGIVPYLLGFHPLESVVALFLTGQSVALTVRLDLPSAADVTGLVEHLLALRDGQQASDILVLVYSRRTRGRRVGEALAAAFGPYAREVLLVGERRWWSMTCEQGCCPVAGTAFDPTSLRVSAEAVVAGLTALGDRDEVADQTRGPSGTDHPALEAGLSQARTDLAGRSRRRRQAQALDLVAGALNDPARLTDDTCLLLAALVADVWVRDVVWVAMTRERADDHLALWRRVVARTPPSGGAAPICLLGMAAWMAGQGALLNCCIDRASVVDPSYTMTDILAEISAAAVPPSFWDEWSESMGDHPQLRVGLTRRQRRR